MPPGGLILGAILGLSGRRSRLGASIDVAGIAPPRFYGDRIDPRPPASWILPSVEPLLRGNLSVLHEKNANWLYLLWRLDPSATPEAVSAKITTNLRQWLAIGLPIALLGAHLIASQLYNVRSYDPISLLVGPAGIAAGYCGYKYASCAKAASVEPVTALRAE